MDREPSGSGRDKSLSYRWWLSALEPMLSWQSGELLPSFLPSPSLSHSYFPPPSFLPSFASLPWAPRGAMSWASGLMCPSVANTIVVW